jgi:thiol reductant ABC exporter CydD subunit
MLVTLPLVPVFMWLVGRHAERRAHERWRALALLSNHFLDVVRGLPTLRAFGRGREQRARIEAVSEEYRRATMGTLRVAFLSGAVLELAATLGIALVAVVVGVRLSDGRIGFEPALTVLVLTPELYLPLRNLASQFHASADGNAVAARMLDLVDAPRPSRGGAALPAPVLQPIRFERVSYRYPLRGSDVLCDLDLELEPGETVAVVGPSGGGKSTLLSLLLRFAEPTAGRILVGTSELASLDAAAWRALTAYVPQHPTLFRGTVADNIRLGDPGAGEERVREAADLAGAHGFVSQLRDGYETRVGEGGRLLSTGQRRRIALARAFLRDAPLVLLDEPTADLDPESATLVGGALERLRGDRTVLLVAHDVELAGRADRIVRLVAGRALEPAAEAA